MSDETYTVKREIENVTFTEEKVERIRKEVKKELIDEGRDNVPESVIESKVKDRLVEIAVDNTLYSQGDNRLHNKINHTIEES